MQFAGVLLRRHLVSSFFVVIDKAKRIVEMGYLANIQFIDVAPGPAVTSPPPLK